MRNGVSIIIPTCNGGRTFSESMSAIRRQEWVDDLQLIVIDSGSTDGTVELAESAGALVKRIPRKHFHHARTRNEAVGHTFFDRIIFMVQDAVPDSEQWLSQMVHGLKKHGGAAAFAAQIPHLDATPYARFETESVAYARLNSPELGNIHSMEAFQTMPYDNAYRRIGLDNVCAIYEKEMLEKTPFPDVEFAEDLAWALKISSLGHRIAYLPHIKVRHSHNRLPDYAFRRQIVNSYWLARIMGRLREDLSFLSLQGLAFLTYSVRTLVLRKIQQKLAGIDGFQLEALFIDRLWKQYPFKLRIWIRRRHPFFSKYQYAPSLAVQEISQRLETDILSQLELIEAGYPPRDRKEWFHLLEQVVANILGRMHGEVYAGCMLKSSVPRHLERFIKPFLSGV